MGAMENEKSDDVQRALTPDQQRDVLRGYEKAWEEVDRLRAERLRGMPYNAEEVMALLDLGESYDGPPRFAEGMVEMQRLFMLLAKRLNTLPDARDERAGDAAEETS